MAYKDFADDTVLFASDVDNFLMRQTVMVFADETARTAALGTVVTEGMFTFLTSTDSFQYYTGSAWQNVVPAPSSTINASNVVNTQTNSTATSYTFGTADQGTTVRFTSASTVTATISTATALTAGQRIDVIRDGAGRVNLTAGSGVSMAGAGTVSSGFFMERYEAASIYCVEANTYRIIGNVTAF
jgi:hypothetical protein